MNAAIMITEHIQQLGKDIAWFSGTTAWHRHRECDKRHTTIHFPDRQTATDGIGDNSIPRELTLYYIDREW